MAKVKENLEEMRAEKIKIQAHLQTVKNEKEDMARTMQASRTSNHEQLGRTETLVAELRTEITGLKDRLQVKETSLASTEKRLDSLIEAEKIAKK